MKQATEEAAALSLARILQLRKPNASFLARSGESA